MGQFTFLAGTAYHAACVVQPRTNGQPSTRELIAMIKQCQINKSYQFPYLLETHLQAARADPDVLSTLSALDEIIYAGSSLRASEEEWAGRNGINLVNVYGCTECGVLLVSEGTLGDYKNLLKPHPGAIFEFVPIASDGSDGSDLVELIVPREAPECPDESLRAADGRYHTRDLFREVEAGKYTYCGRSDDWINMENCSRLCNAEGIEGNVQKFCGNIIAGCVVVGEGRPSPILIVETNDLDSKRRTEIFRRINGARYFHERIGSEKMIISVLPGQLPRTANKGTVRRRGAEIMFKNEIDNIFG
ncbi:hypothetical protein D9757_005615 [Collybiopsis confluens]|uniref:AMP-dependent synthetase/ligase domain-containing protein n=1 Tax=Collybiopsis confluens TaxID=2823264 RepID=A0A8H5HSF5_9AGAR|nr:hypothetical protein D9757_005615 [Collybiopsis confluens]